MPCTLSAWLFSEGLGLSIGLMSVGLTEAVVSVNGLLETAEWLPISNVAPLLIVAEPKSAGGSVISVPPLPSLVSLKFAVV